MSHPPKFAKLLLRILTRHEYDRVFIGDVEEAFHQKIEKTGTRRIRLWYWCQVAKALPGFFRNRAALRMHMLKSHVTLSLRNMVRHKGYSAINIIGLSLGMACCMLIFLYVKQELSFDRFHENRDNIYRIISTSQNAEGVSMNVATPAPAAPAFKENFPEIRKITRIFTMGRILVSHGTRQFYEQGLIFADPSFFEIFSFPVLSGQASGVLPGPDSIVLTESVAHKYFGSADPVGQTLRLDNSYDFQVTGVIADSPVNSQIQFDMIASFKGLTDDMVGIPLEQWGAHLVYTYALFNPEFDKGLFTQKALALVQSHVSPNPEVKHTIGLQPLTWIHLHSNDHQEITPGNSIKNLIVISTIGFLVLLIACFNFINLTTARAMKRGREVGMRKVMGALRQQVIKQFLGESLVLAFSSMAVAAFLTQLLLPLFSSLVGIPVRWNLHNDFPGFLALCLLPLLVGALGGIYPALFLSSFQPVQTLHRTWVIQRRKGGRIRQILVTGQFAVSIFLLISVWTVYGQLRYVLNADLGFNKQQTLVIPLQDESMKKNLESLEIALEKIPGVESVASSFGTPIGNAFSSGIYPNGLKGGGVFDAGFKFIDRNYIIHYGLTLLAGRGFSKEFTNDSLKSFIINEKLMHKLGFASPQDAIGKKFSVGLNNITGTVIGVVKDFHPQSLHSPIWPLVFLYYPRIHTEVAVRIQKGAVQDTLPLVRETWKKFSPDYPFIYNFLDESINKAYARERKTFRTIGLFCILAVFIACLGLYSLASHTTEQRIKEIAIRKILGSSLREILALINREFSRLVLLSNILAWPLAYYLMQKWLRNFAYRIDIPWYAFVLSALAALLIASVTVSYHSIKSATANPAATLRHE